MLRLPTLALVGALVTLSGGLIGQDAKKEDPKAATKATKDDPPAKAKGMLPPHWGKVGLSDDQKQEIYRIQTKYRSDIVKLQAKIDELEGTRTREMRGVLTADQKKRLEEILLGKDK